MSGIKKYFITYGTKEFHLQKLHICNLAKKTNLFDETIALSPKDLDKNFVNEYSSIFSQPIGGGYYIWKFKIILDTLSKIKNDDFLFYIDAGSSINYKSKKTLQIYIDKLYSSKYDHAAFKMHHLQEKYWTTKEVFSYFNLDLESREANEGQYMATVLMFKKSKKSLDYLRSFEKVIQKDPQLITDFYLKNEQIKNFKFHRHDQSIFSLLNKIYGCEEFDSKETYFKENPKDQYNYPILTVRKRVYKFHQKVMFFIKYPININKVLYFKEKPTLVEKVIFKISKKIKGE